MVQRSPPNAERRLTAATGYALVAAAVLLLTAAAINKERGWSAHAWFGAAAEYRGRFYAAHVFLLACGVLLLLGMLGLARLTLPRQPTATALASALILLGFLGGVAMVGMDLVVWLFAGSSLEPGRIVEVLDGVKSNPGVVIPLAGLLLGLAAGPGLLARTLYREHLVSGGTALLLAVGVTGGILSFPVPGLRLLGATCLLASAARIGVGLIANHPGRDEPQPMT
jgi:hypothetical protein